MRLSIFLLLISSCVLAAAQNTPTLTITSPLSGLVIQPGQTLAVTVSGTNPPISGNEGLVITDPIVWPTAQTSSTNNQFTLTIPSGIDPGSYSITAVESSTSSGLIVSSPVVVTVSPNYNFSSLAADVNTVLFSAAGETCPLVIQGTTAGVAQLVSNQFLTFVSANMAIASVDSNGIITPQSTGTTKVSFSYGTVSGSVTVLVGTAITTASQTAAATFTPNSGTFSSPQSVSLLDATIGAVIYYTVNGTTPSTSSSVYTSPITVSSNETIEAIAVAPGYTSSAVSSASYVILPTAATPSFSPVGGSYSAAQTITISDATAGASIYYTTNGVTPTATSALYSAPLNVSASETIQAIAFAAGSANSSVASAAYIINIPTVSTPSFSPASGGFTAPLNVTISDLTPGAAIYYTTNGSPPTANSAQYSGPIIVSSSETLSAIAVETGYSNSAVATALYSITLAAAAVPTFSPAAGTYSSAQKVSIGDGTSGATIYYTVDGSTPTTASSVYMSPLNVTTTESINAIAAASGFTFSPVASALYTISAPQDFGLVLNTSSMTVTSSQSGTAIVTITPQSTFNQPITLTCSGLPAVFGLSCTFSPGSVTPNGSTATTTLVVRESLSASLGKGTKSVEFACMFGALLLIAAPSRRRYRRMGASSVIVLSVGLIISGCGSPTTTKVTVTATAGTAVHTATFNLILK